MEPVRQGKPINRSNWLACSLLLLTGVCRAADELPYDALWRTFGVYLSPTDALAWPAKLRAVTKDQNHFWRGTRDLFYAWAGEHCHDWLADRAAYTVSHGDLHLGNIGSYASRDKFGRLAYGEVDFDESARLPVQFELLQGLVTFELIARDNKIDLSDADQARLQAAVFDTYAAALAKPPADTGVARLLKDRTGRAYEEDLDRFTHGGRFRKTVEKKGVVTDVLRPLNVTDRAAIARGLAEAVQHDARLAALLRPYDASDFSKVILDVAERTRVDSSGSQGLVKLLVLLRKPFRGRGHDGLIYLKQQLPAAAERAEIIPPVDGPPGRRYVRDMNALTHGGALASSWCEIAGRSFWVSVKEPWSSEPDSADLKDVDDVIKAATIWARVAADSHRDDAARLLPLLIPACRAAVVARAKDYLAWQATAFKRLVDDARTQRDIAADLP